VLTTDAITTLPYIGPKQSWYLSNLGINTLGDMLYHFPVYYKDTSEIVLLSDLDREHKKTVRVILEQISNIRLRGGKTLQKGLVSDDSGQIKVTWFNQPFLTRALKEGSEVLLSGKLNSKSLIPELSSPDYEPLKTENINLGKIVPVYPLTEGITIKWLRSRFSYLVKHLEQFTDLIDHLPEAIITKYQLVDLKTALEHIHNPGNKSEIISARKRLAFDELLGIYQKLIRERIQRQQSPAIPIKIDPARISEFIHTLPFRLTPSQMKAITEITNDLAKPHPMNRLLQGDVGSGKTIVALTAALPVLEAGAQVIIMVPTTVLAQQHYEVISKLLKNKFRIGLITSSTLKESKTTLKLDLIIATHSILFHKSEYIHNLGLLIIDEQHRFGVEQRRELLNLKDRKIIPHLLNLTATPIPRSVALTLFGEIDVSMIAKPEGRKENHTLLVPQNKKDSSYDWLKNKLHSGGQIFWICPLIEENTDTSDILAVETQFERIKDIFKDFRVALMHGKLSAKVKSSIINSLKAHQIDILVSTTVIEVGIDIPDANVIIIENSERYGLAQLHQLRGRVGRNNQDSWCLLYTNMEGNPDVTTRLNYFAKETNGIKIAEFDLQNRGPGEVYGTIQAGIPELKIANFGNNAFLALVREAAHSLLK